MNLLILILLYYTIFSYFYIQPKEINEICKYEICKYEYKYIYIYYYLIGKKRMSTTLQVYTAKFILEASHQCQRETPKEDKILWIEIVLCSKRTLFEQRSKQFGVHGPLHLLSFKSN